eukprot:30076-Eustigmatos_ZCMA.PRE.1
MSSSIAMMEMVSAVNRHARFFASSSDKNMPAISHTFRYTHLQARPQVYARHLQRDTYKYVR